MRKQICLMFALLMALPCAGAAPFDSGPEEDGWSWRDGLLGSGGPEGDIFADEELYPGVICDICRDPYEHPMDFAAVAYNSYFGEVPWMRESILGVPFRIYNLQRQWVVVWFEDFAFDGISLLPNTMSIHVRLQNGQVLTFSVIQGGPDLPFGDPNPEPPTGNNNCNCGGDGGDGDADDDYDEPEEDLPEAPDRWGHVEIEDPDEDGDFGEWEL